jgi:transcriptional regulator with XRE-family HTH domain
MKNTRLRDAIFEKDLTQKIVANETGIRAEYLSMAINGKMFLNRTQRRRIAVFLGRPENELFPVETHFESVAHELGLGS